MDTVLSPSPPRIVKSLMNPRISFMSLPSESFAVKTAILWHTKNWLLTLMCFIWCNIVAAAFLISICINWVTLGLKELLFSPSAHDQLLGLKNKSAQPLTVGGRLLRRLWLAALALSSLFLTPEVMSSFPWAWRYVLKCLKIINNLYICGRWILITLV